MPFNHKPKMYLPTNTPIFLEMNCGGTLVEIWVLNLTIHYASQIIS